MPELELATNERAAVEMEQARAYFAEGNGLKWAGAVVLSLVVAVVFDHVPAWTWLPALACLYVVTVVGNLRHHQFVRQPERMSGAKWLLQQTRLSALAGICWGLANTAMLVHLPAEFHLVILTVATVAAATSSAQGFANHRPATAYILASLVPPTVWLVTLGDRLHGILGVMLMIFISLTVWLGKKRNRVFVEAQCMRFRNEALARELLRQRDVADHAREGKAKFLAAASHDLRQPMQALSIFIELLGRDEHSAKTNHLVQRAQRAVDAMNMLLNALLDVSKLDAGAVKPNRRPFAMQELLDDMAREFLPVTERRGLQLDILPCSAIVDSDPILLGDLLRNLVSNAVRYTPRGRIVVGCRRGVETLRIEVLDTGIGIPADQHEAIFGEFYQIGNKERNREQGLGLGLAIVDRLARLLDHPVALDSQEGRGSRFAVTVPRTAGAVSAEAAIPAENVGLPHDLAGLLVLVIEDEETIRTALTELLERWGCEVIAADSAADALRKIDGDAGAVDAVISDMRLTGDTDGIGAIAAVRARCGRDLPAFLVTGDTSQAALTAARNANLPMLHKPIKPARLRAALTGVIGSNPLRSATTSHS